MCFFQKYMEVYHLNEIFFVICLKSPFNLLPIYEMLNLSLININFCLTIRALTESFLTWNPKAFGLPEALDGLANVSCCLGYFEKKGEPYKKSYIQGFYPPPPPRTYE